MTIRYDTLVIKNSTSKSVPQKAAGGQVCSWSAGHSLAELSVYEEFLDNLIAGDFDGKDLEVLAIACKERAGKYRDGGYQAEGDD